MDNIPVWATTDDPRVGRYVTCGEIPYKVIAVDYDEEGDMLLVFHPTRGDLQMWIDVGPNSYWHFVNILDEIMMSM